MKLNKKGFVLAETLVVAVFMATIFTIIYVNFYPLIGEYEKREYYDDLDSKYDIYWFKRLVQNEQALSTYTWKIYTGEEYNSECDHDSDGYCDKDITTAGYADKPQLLKDGYIDLISCTMFTTAPNNINNIDYQQMCNNLKIQTKIQKLYLTTYYLSGTTKQDTIYKEDKDPNAKYFKNYKDNFDENMKDYIDYLPDFRFASPNGARYRLIAQFERHTSTDPAEDIKYYTYATIEINREKGV